jgi:membrane protease YdiL (CAAX protease family)
VTRLANLTISKFLVGGTAVAITYFGIQLLFQTLLFPLVNGRNLNLAGGILVFGLLFPVLDLAVALAVVAVYALYVHLMEKRPLTEFDRHNGAADFRNGCLWTLLFLAVLLIPLTLHGNLVIGGINDWGLHVPSLIAASAMAAVCEEIFFRGLLFRLTESSLGSVIAVVFSSLLFGAAHYFNPHATLMRAIGLGLEAGLGLSALYMLTRTLWICIAMHFTWNLVNALLALPTSGGRTAGLFQSSLRGNELLTGGDFGIEASALVIIPGIVIGTYLLILAYKRHRFIPPFWARNSSVVTD